MKKVKFLTVFSLLLLIFNIGLISYIIYGKKHPPRFEGPRDIIIEKLQFDEQQIVQYDTFIYKHRKLIKAKEEEIMHFKKALYKNLNLPTEVKVKDSLLLEISKSQMKIEQIHYAHFEEIKGLCKDTQKQYFEQLTAELADYFNHNRLPKKTKK